MCHRGLCWVWRPSEMSCDNTIEKDALSATQPVRPWSIARDGSNALPWHPSHAPSTGCYPWQAWVCKEWRRTLHTHFEAQLQSQLRTGHHYTQLLHLVLVWMDNFVVGFNRTLLTTTTFPFLFFFKGFRFNWFFPDLSSNFTIVISTDPNKAINE